MLRWLGAGLGAVAWALRIRRRTAIRNLRQALPTRDCKRLGRQVFAHAGQAVAEVVWLALQRRQRSGGVIATAATSQFHQLLSAGKGVLVLSAHLGGWDALACFAAAVGMPVNVITREIRNTRINSLWMRTRQRWGVRLLAASDSARSVLSALRRNEVVVFVLDQHQPGGAVVPFFCQPAATLPSLARIALTTSSPVVPVFLLRSPDGFTLRLHPPVPLMRTGDRATDVALNTSAYTAILESEIGTSPEQWFWLHRRWKVSAAQPVRVSVV